jgi:hypothetical protein
LARALLCTLLLMACVAAGDLCDSRSALPNAPCAGGYVCGAASKECINFGDDCGALCAKPCHSDADCKSPCVCGGAASGSITLNQTVCIGPNDQLDCG